MKKIKIKGTEFNLEDKDYCFAVLLEEIAEMLKELMRKPIWQQR